MNARENILARIRRAHGKPGGEPAAADLERVGAALAKPVTGPQPAFAHPPDLLAQFLKECDRLGTTHAQVASEADIPREVARYLAAAGLAPRVVAWPGFAPLDWKSPSWSARRAPRTGTTPPGSRAASAPSPRRARRCCCPRPMSPR